MCSPAKLFITFSTLSCCLVILNAEIIKYRRHMIESNRPEYIVIPKFDKDEVPHWSPGDGNSFIDLSQLKIHASCDPKEALKLGKTISEQDHYCKETVFDVLFFEAPEDPNKKTWLDHWVDGQYCCTDTVIDNNGCSANMRDRLIIPDSLKHAYSRSVLVETNKPSHMFGDQHEITHHSIKESGLYVMIMALCDAFSEPVVIDGSVESLDPYGYVPPDQFGNLPYYASLCLMYLAVAITWGVLCFWYKDQLMPLQLWISAVLGVAMIEVVLMYAHYIDWNSHGYPSTAITTLGLIFGAVKRALSRILIMLVALGYGVVKPALGEDMHRVLFLGVAYFALSLTYSLMSHLQPNTREVYDPDYDIISLLVFLTAVVDTTFYIWIFTSINNLLVSLASRKQGAKYLLYRNFRNVLIVLLVFTVAWVFYSSVVFLNDSGGENYNWRWKWTVDALWELIYFIIFVSIAVLWAPSNNAQRYAYSIELSQLEDDSEFAAQVESATAIGDDGEIDDEYGGRLQDDKDPFQGTGALDTSMAISKKA